MAHRTVYQKGRFTVIKNSHDYIVINTQGNYMNHSHFDTYKGALKCIQFITKGVLPGTPYFIQAVKRLLTDDEFGNLHKDKKQIYYNPQKGLRR